MTKFRWYLLWILLVAILFAERAPAQSTEFFPEANLNVNLKPDLRLVLHVKETRENGENNQTEFGGTFDFHIKPLLNLQKITRYDIDQSKSRLLAFSFGYYRLFSNGSTAPTNRYLFQATPNLPVKGGLLLSDRNRGELNYSNANLTWRYRNRIAVQRTVKIKDFHWSPYVSAEFFYDSKYGKFSNTYLDAGVLIPIKKFFQIDTYYEHQNNTGNSPNQQVNALGLAANFFF
jgi:hypothetical protein